MGQPLQGNSDSTNASGTPRILGESPIYNGILGFISADNTDYYFVELRKAEN